MTTFITYVELHSADRKDYQVLHTAMKKETFTVAKAYSAGTRVEFRFHGTSTIQQVIDAVLRAAVKTGKKFSFTVMRDKAYKAESRKKLQDA